MPLHGANQIWIFEIEKKFMKRTTLEESIVQSAKYLAYSAQAKKL